MIRFIPVASGGSSSPENEHFMPRGARGSRQPPGDGLGMFAQTERRERLPTVTLGFFSAHLPRPSHGVRRLPSRGFTLMEVLVVLSIMTILTTITLLSLAGLSPAGKFNSAVGNLSETLGLARETAVAHNTYVWVAFAIAASPSGPPSLGTLVVASADGTNPFGSAWSPSTLPVALPDPHFIVLTKLQKYSNCQFLDAGVITPANIPALPSQASQSANALATNASGFFTINSPSGLITYTRVFEYTPSGLVYNGPNPVTFVEFGVQPGPISTTTVTSQNVACFRVPFITGRTMLYRP